MAVSIKLADCGAGPISSPSRIKQALTPAVIIKHKVERY
jgi:hypothetical protein